MFTSPYFNYPQIFEDYNRNFGMVLIYIPQPGQESLVQIDEGICAALQPANAVPLRLPSAFNLMTAGQIEILVTKGFGELSTTTSLGKKETHRMQIQMGASYQAHIRPEELTRIRGWCDRVTRDLGHQHWQWLPKPPH